MRVAIIGSGNVASVLGRLALNSEHVVVHVASRSLAHAALLAKELDASHSDYHGLTNVNADIVIVAVADQAIKDCIATINSRETLLVHTAGAAPMNILQTASDRYGVLYPLQSLRKELLPTDDVPFLIDGNTEDIKHEVAAFALSLSNNVTVANDDERLKHHAAAVIVNNFVNHLYVLTEQFCTNENLAFKTMLPLIKETTLRLSSFSPSTLQTGPALRNDADTIAKHKNIFNSYPELYKIYEAFTESIRSRI